MNSTLLGIVIGASVSLVTLVIAKIFDFLAINKTHKLLLKKEYFLKKLDSIEKSVTLFKENAGILNNNSIVVDSFSMEKLPLDGNEIGLTLKSLSESFDKIRENNREASSQIGLYVDLPNTSKLNEIVEEYFKLSNKAATNSDSLKFKRIQYEIAFEHIDNEERGDMSAEIQEYVEKIKQTLRRLKSLSIDYSSESETIINNLRNHFRKYE